MATEEIAVFNVRNTSLRVVHIGGVMIPPEQVVAIMDDAKGINRKSVEGEPEFLEETEDDVTYPPQALEEKPKATTKKAKGAAPAAGATATGATWNAPKK